MNLHTISGLVLGFGIGEFFKTTPNLHTSLICMMIALAIVNIDLAITKSKIGKL